jgi:hypothetical protein
MRRALMAAASTVAATSLIVIPAAPSSAHSQTHTVNISGSMFITDDETFGSNEHATVTFNKNLSIGPLLGSDTFIATGCAGGEVRIELTVTVVDGDDAGSVSVFPTLRMLEGTSCSSNDLDGTFVPPAFSVAANTTVTTTQRVNNNDEGGDRADVTLNVRNITT